MATCYLVGWCQLTLAEQAAWVQAIGTIAALLIAVGAPLYHGRVVRLRQEREGSKTVLSVARWVSLTVKDTALAFRESRLDQSALPLTTPMVLEGVSRVLVAMPITSVPGRSQPVLLQLHEAVQEASSLCMAVQDQLGDIASEDDVKAIENLRAALSDIVRSAKQRVLDTERWWERAFRRRDKERKNSELRAASLARRQNRRT